MKKKIVTLLIIGLITGVLFGCSTKQNSSSQTSESNTSENNNSENSGSESTPPSGDEIDNLDYDKQFEQFKQARPDYRERLAVRPKRSSARSQEFRKHIQARLPAV